MVPSECSVCIWATFWQHVVFHFYFYSHCCVSRSALLGHFAHPSSALQGSSISSTSSFCLCSEGPGQEATYLSWCGPEPLLVDWLGMGILWLLQEHWGCWA